MILINSKNRQVEWAIECDFIGNDIGNTKGRSEECGSACLARGDCASFAWTGHEGGICWLKMVEMPVMRMILHATKS